MFTEFLWKKFARFCARPRVAEAIIRWAKRTPYLHLASPDGSVYMERYWVFNPYDRATNVPRWAPLIPFSVRVHHIRREDLDRHLHDHPWNARTIILKGWYMEKRNSERDEELFELVGGWRGGSDLKWRRAGETARLKFGEYRSICEVSPGGVFTLFFSWRWQGVWGFLVDGVKVPWKEYLGLEPSKDLPHIKSMLDRALEMTKGANFMTRDQALRTFAQGGTLGVGVAHVPEPEGGFQLLTSGEQVIPHTKCKTCGDTGFMCVGETAGSMHQPPEPILEPCHCDIGEQKQGEQP